MPTNRVLEEQFLQNLRGVCEFELAGFKATPLPEGGIAIIRRGNVRGVWSAGEERLRWRPADVVVGGFEVDDVDEALRRMMKIVLASLQVRASVGRRIPVAA